MATHAPRKPHHTHVEDRDDPEPGQLPIDPDEGPVAPLLPTDPAHDPPVDPEA